jgi:hypothetical protein
MFDFDRDWHEGFDPGRRFEWKRLVKDHPVEVGLIFLLAVELLVWWGVS